MTATGNRAVMLVVVAACSTARPSTDVDLNPDAGNSADGNNPNGGGDAGGSVGTVNIFAHTASALYRVDPDTLAITKVGDFNWPSGTMFDQGMTDIAIDKGGEIIGATFFSVYKIDPTTAQITQLSSSLQNTFNGLSFVPADAIGMTGDDVLIGTRTTDGKVYRVDPMTGATTQIGDMGAFQSSGDLVGIAGFGTVQTVKGPTNDRLVRLAPNTFQATAIGTDIGFPKIWGVGFWKGTVYGFTEGGQLISIDPNTGSGQLVADGGPPWWGAAVTTIAPILL